MGGSSPKRSWAANLAVRRSNVLYLLGRYGEARAQLEAGHRRYRELIRGLP